MIRFGATLENGRRLIGLGISDENIARLRQGKPIFVAGSSVGVPEVEIIICWGATEYELTEQLASLIGPETDIRAIRRDELPPDHPDRA